MRIVLSWSYETWCGESNYIPNARVRLVIDIAFGDPIEPDVQDTDLPVLLVFPAHKLRSYPRETVIAEKFQAMVALGLANSRLKDFYNVWVLNFSHTFEGDALARSIRATFERRNIEIPGQFTDAFTVAFTEVPARRTNGPRYKEAVFRGISGRQHRMTPGQKEGCQNRSP